MVEPQPNDLDHKKKRQTLERAKANHLSKQLQMRLQYAKLKVEHGWQRQNLNEVENLYFHHSHLRSVRQHPHGTGPPDTHVVLASSTPSGVADQPNDDPDSVSPPPEHADAPLTPSLQAPIPAALGSSTLIPSMNRPPSAFDLADPHFLARLAQLQAQIQVPPQSVPRQPSTSSQPVLIPGLAAFPPPIQPQNQPTAVPFSTYSPQPFVGTSTPGSTPLYVPTSSSAPQNLIVAASPSLTPAATSSTAPIPATQTTIAPSALTYDSFWSTHASSSGPTRALYRTHTGFTASATPTGNVAMLTPGGNAAVMTADGVYVGGATNRGG